MQQVLQVINNLGFEPLHLGESFVAANHQAQLSAINIADASIMIGEGAVVDLIMIYGESENSTLSLYLNSGATLRLTQLFVGNSKVDVTISQAEGATSKVVAASLKSATSNYEVKLEGSNAHSELYTLQMGGEQDNNAININMRHNSADCTSRSLSKCAASGVSNLRFEGLVYVAPDAQRTAAEQNCRCVELSDGAHIVAQPQLEIYADDVKCSHGATMGQVDSEAILYMRQRGLSEAQARRVQIEGFVVDIVEKCATEKLREALEQIVAEKLEEM